MRPSVDPGAAIQRRHRPARVPQLWIGATSWWRSRSAATAASSALTLREQLPRPRPAGRPVAASTRGDAGFSVLLGPVTAIDTVGGYTVYKCFVFLTTIGAIWALLAATRLLRGEEDSGRWQLVLAGAPTRPAPTLATVAALGGAIGVVFVGTTAIIAARGAQPDVGFTVGGSLVFALSMAAAPAIFGVLAVVCSQLAQTRRLATGLSVAVFGVFFVVRMIGDSGSRASWLLWLTPLGWIEKVEPFTADNVWPLVPGLLVIVAAGAVSVVLAARRDAGAGAIASHEVRPPRAYGLRSPFGLATRLNLPVLTAWTVGVVATSFLMGIVTKSVATALEGSSSMNDVLAELGASGSGALQYLGTVFLLTGGVLALVPASQIGPARDEEASGRRAKCSRRPRRGRRGSPGAWCSRPSPSP